MDRWEWELVRPVSATHQVKYQIPRILPILSIEEMDKQTDRR